MNIWILRSHSTTSTVWRAELLNNSVKISELQKALEGGIDFFFSRNIPNFNITFQNGVIRMHKEIIPAQSCNVPNCIGDLKLDTFNFVNSFRCKSSHMPEQVYVWQPIANRSILVSKDKTYIITKNLDPLTPLKQIGEQLATFLISRYFDDNTTDLEFKLWFDAVEIKFNTGCENYVETYIESLNKPYDGNLCILTQLRG